MEESLVSSSDQWVKDYFLYEEGTQPPKIYDHLKSAKKFWEEDLKADTFVMDIVKNGYKIPFIAFPPTMEKKNNCSALKHQDFVSEAIKELLDSNLIELVSKKPHIVSPL